MYLYYKLIVHTPILNLLFSVRESVYFILKLVIQYTLSFSVISGVN